MGATLSRGPTQLRAWIASWLSVQLPLMIEQAWDDWGIEPWQLPKPQIYDAYDLPIVGANMYPAIGADFPNETNNIRTDFTDRAEPEYWSNQTGSVYVWVASPRDPTVDKLEENPRAACMRVRDDLTELVKQCLLGRPSLGQGQNTCWLEETSVNVNKTDPWRSGENRPDFIAGATIPVVYRVKSELSFPILGTAETFDVEVRKLHPEEED